MQSYFVNSTVMKEVIIKLNNSLYMICRPLIVPRKSILKFYSKIHIEIDLQFVTARCDITQSHWRCLNYKYTVRNIYSKRQMFRPVSHYGSAGMFWWRLNQIYYDESVLSTKSKTIYNSGHRPVIHKIPCIIHIWGQRRLY